MVRPHVVADGPVQEPEPVPAVTGSGVAGWLRDALPVLHNISVTVLSGGDWSWAIALVQLGVPRVHCMALRNEALASLRRLTSFVPGLQCVDQPPTPSHIVCGHVTISDDIPLFVASVPSSSLGAFISFPGPRQPTMMAIWLSELQFQGLHGHSHRVFHRDLSGLTRTSTIIRWWSPMSKPLVDGYWPVS